jgi:aldehyde oxidoreductase
VKDAIGGVLCRCTGYSKIIQAIMTAADEPAPALRAERGGAVGARIDRLDGLAKVMGTDVFGADGWPAGTLLVKVIRSPHHRARFEFGDIEAFRRRHPGIVDVMSATTFRGATVSASSRRWPTSRCSRTVKRASRARRWPPWSARRRMGDLDDFPVTWEPLAPLLEPEEALAEGADLVHANRAGNVLVRGLCEQGRRRGRAEGADVVVEGRYSTGFIEHAYIEPEAGWAVRVGDRLEVHAGTQAPYMHRDDLALILGPAEGVRAGRADDGRRRLRQQARPVAAPLHGAGRVADEAARAAWSIRGPNR